MMRKRFNIALAIAAAVVLGGVLSIGCPAIAAKIGALQVETSTSTSSVPSTAAGGSSDALARADHGHACTPASSSTAGCLQAADFQTFSSAWRPDSDGAGSGLDADKLDGLEPASLAVGTAAALAADPADCSGMTWARGIGASGAAVCETLEASEITGTIPDSKLSTLCPSGQVLKATSEGAFTCASDDNTLYFAGDGLAGTSTFGLDAADCDLTTGVKSYPSYVAGTGWTCRSDVLANLSCAGGQSPSWSGTAWECSYDVNAGNGPLVNDLGTMRLTACPSGQFYAWNAGSEAWLCTGTAPTATTATTAADLQCSGACVADSEIAGVSGSKVSGAVPTATAFAADPADCSGMTWARGVNASGAAVCETLEASEITGTIPDGKLSSSCANGQILRANPEGVYYCDADRDGLGGLSCAGGQSPSWSGTAWVCSYDVNAGSGPLVNDLGTMRLTPCPDGQFYAWSTTSEAWLCTGTAPTATTAASASDLACSGTCVSDTEIAAVSGSKVSGAVASATNAASAGDLACASACVADSEIAAVSGAKVSGAVPTATALAADPADCSGMTWARGVNASGAAVCETLEASEITGTIPDGKLSSSCASGQILRANPEGAYYCDADRDGLGGLSCAGNQSPVWTGSAWACSYDVNAGSGPLVNDLGTMRLTACPAGQFYAWNAGSEAWLCTGTAPTATTATTASDLQCSGACVADAEIAGVSGSKVSGTVASATTATSATTAASASDLACSGQCVSDAEIAAVSGAKVSGAVPTATALAADPTDCTAGQYATGITATGVPVCSTPPDDDTTYSATANKGLLLEGTGFGLATCTAGYHLRASSTTGEWYCSNTTVYASSLYADPADCTGDNWARGIAAGGGAVCARPGFVNLSGQAALSQLPDCEATGAILKYDTTTGWACSTDEDHTYAAGDGLAGTSTFGLDATDCDLTAGVKSYPSYVAGTGWTCRSDALANLSCAGGQSPSWSGTAWECSYDVNAGAAPLTNDLGTMRLTPCPDGQFYKWSSSTETWTCTNTASALVANGTDCSGTSWPRGIDAAGNATCETLDVADTNGTVPYNRGGTGATAAFVQGGVAYGSSSTAIGTTAVGTSGQALVSAGTGTPAWRTVGSAVQATTIYRSTTTYAATSISWPVEAGEEGTFVCQLGVSTQVAALPRFYFATPTAASGGYRATMFLTSPTSPVFLNASSLGSYTTACTSGCTTSPTTWEIAGRYAVSPSYSGSITLYWASSVEYSEVALTAGSSCIINSNG